MGVGRRRRRKRKKRKTRRKRANRMTSLTYIDKLVVYFTFNFLMM